MHLLQKSADYWACLIKEQQISDHMLYVYTHNKIPQKGTLCVMSAVSIEHIWQT